MRVKIEAESLACRQAGVKGEVRKLLRVYGLWLMGVLLSLITYHLSLITTVHAQTAIDTTTTYEIADKEAVDGEILVFKENKFVRASEPYSAQIFGVLTDGPLIVFKGFDNNRKSIATSGVVKVLVTAKSGPIKPGDFITSSEVLGKGQKAATSGHILGMALEGFSGSGVGKINVSLRIGYAGAPQESIVDFANLFTTALLENIQNPKKFIQLTKYLIALIIFLISLGFSFLVFARSAINGVKAIGRNPLAKRAILASVTLNIVLAILVSLGGVLLAFILVAVGGG